MAADHIELYVASVISEYLADRVINGTAIFNIETGEVIDRDVATPEHIAAAKKALADHLYAETV